MYATRLVHAGLIHYSLDVFNEPMCACTRMYMIKEYC